MRHPANETPEAAAFQGRPETEGADEMQSPSRAAIAIFSVIFFFSGATALVYQIVWMRKLSLFFGSDVYSAAITLSAFMGGLCVGSWLAGRLARGSKRPLFTYAALEIGIALYAVCFAAILGAWDPLLSEIYRSDYIARPWVYQLVRAAIAFLVLLPPTAMMGATLPVVVQHFAVAPRILGARLGYFYAINTVGAFVGTLVGGFALLPLFGVNGALQISAAVNFAIGVAALGLALRSGEVRVAPSPSPQAAASGTSRARRLIPVMIGISGFAALALEVVWVRILVQSFSATVYAFTIMLACFLAGIFIGSAREARRVDSLARPAERLIRLELALFVYVALLAVLTQFVPGVFGALLWRLTALTGGAFGIASIGAQAVAAALLILWPTLWLGAIFPLAVKVYARDINERATDTGSVYAANTLGALLGALAAGFVFIPAFGARYSLLVIAGIFLLAAVAAFPLCEKPAELRDRALRRALLAGIGIMAVAASLPRQILINFNMQRSTQPEVIYHGEGIAHTVDIIRTPSKHTLMMVNGNIEADTTLVQRRHFILKAHLPLLLHRDAKDVAVVGLGLGVTLAATARNPVVNRIRLVELSPEMVEAHRYLRDITGDILSNPKIDLLIDDARNFLNRGSETFDMITADPIHPRITGVGYLYTREYYEAVRAHLRPGGVVLQWMPMYAISRHSFDVAFRTFASAFPYASFWYVRGHGLFLGSLEPLPIDFPTLSARFNAPAVRQDFASIGINSPHELMAHLFMDDAQVRRYLATNPGAGSALNTDDNGYLEYATPSEFLLPTKRIVEALRPFAGWDRSILIGATEDDLAKIDRLYAERNAKLLEELDEPIE